MILTKIGIIREAKFPPDARVVLIPEQIAFLKKNYPVDIVVQPSHGRCFHDDEFTACGVTLQEDLHDCSILLGVKEVPYDLLIPEKTYIFFSHTIKKQPHNKNLMRALLEKKITMIDYECLRNGSGERVIAFGYWAGIIGGHNAFWTYSQRTGAYTLKRAKDCKDFDEVKSLYNNVQIPPVKIMLTGKGRVAKGALEILQTLHIREVSNENFLTNQFNYPVFINLNSENIYRRKSDGGYASEEFHLHPELYESIFLPYTLVADIMVNAIYWHAKAPRLFDKEDMRNPYFNIKVIADLSCDVNGAVPATIRSTTINEPVIGYDVFTESEIAPYIPESIDVMAIDNLPNELPRNASEEFGKQLISQVWNELFIENSQMVHFATICKHGKLNEPYEYLSDYANYISEVSL
jgi:alanine dehydrogenase